MGESSSPALMLLVVPQIWADWSYMAFGVTAVTNSLLETTVLRHLIGAATMLTM